MRGSQHLRDCLQRKEETDTYHCSGLALLLLKKLRCVRCGTLLPKGSSFQHGVEIAPFGFCTWQSDSTEVVSARCTSRYKVSAPTFFALTMEAISRPLPYRRGGGRHRQRLHRACMPLAAALLRHTLICSVFTTRICILDEQDFHAYTNERTVVFRNRTQLFSYLSDACGYLGIPGRRQVKMEQHHFKPTLCIQVLLHTAVWPKKVRRRVLDLKIVLIGQFLSSRKRG